MKLLLAMTALASSADKGVMPSPGEGGHCRDKIRMGDIDSGVMNIQYRSSDLLCGDI